MFGTLILIFAFILLFVWLWNSKKFRGFCRSEKFQNHGMMDDKKALIKAWVSHFLYTKLVAGALFSNSSKLNAIKDRLIQNQKDIGDIIGERFGDNAKFVITQELTKHIQIASELLLAIKNKDEHSIELFTKEFYYNAEAIGDYLDNLYSTHTHHRYYNTIHHDHDHTFKDHMHDHISSLMDHITKSLGNDAHDDISSLDTYFDHGMDMAFDMAKKM
jgi:hypothetical protein